MKKVLGWLLAIMTGITACEGPMWPMGPPGPSGDGYETQWFIRDYDILSHQWELVFDQNMGSLFQFEIPVPEITKFVFDEGAVLCYLVQEISSGGRTSLVQSPLPYTFYGEIDGFFYSENYTFEVRTGYINFIVKYSDFDTEIKPLSCTFHVVLIW